DEETRDRDCHLRYGTDGVRRPDEWPHRRRPARRSPRGLQCETEPGIETRRKADRVGSIRHRREEIPAGTAERDQSSDRDHGEVVRAPPNLRSIRPLESADGRTLERSARESRAVIDVRILPEFDRTGKNAKRAAPTLHLLPADPREGRGHDAEHFARRDEPRGGAGPYPRADAPLRSDADFGP